MSNILDTLVTNSAFLTHTKFDSHKEHSISFFSQINPRITLRDTLRGTIQDLLMWIDLDDEESKPMLLDIKDSEGQPTGKYRILIPG